MLGATGSGFTLAQEADAAGLDTDGRRRDVSAKDCL
jgi:hypothetical protein